MALLLVAAPARADRLWSSPWDGTEVLDQQQTEAGPGSHVAVREGAPAGQTFVPQAASLGRLDLRINNRRDERPGAIHLYRWAGSRERTVAAAPIWSDVVELSGEPGFFERAFFPGVAVRPGAAYYFELSAQGRGSYDLQHAYKLGDRYRRGRLHHVIRGRPVPADWDLWFRTFAPPPPDAAPPPPAPPVPDAPPRWRPPRRAPAPVTRDDYLERVRRFAAHVRPALRRECRQRLGGNAAREAFLYRASCRGNGAALPGAAAAGRCAEEHARAARDIVRAAYAWRFCAPHVHPRGAACAGRCSREEKRGGGWIVGPGLAALWLEGSPSLGAEDRRLLRELIVDAAQSGFAKREFATHNRALQAALGYRLAARIAPDHPDAAAWQAYAEDIWGRFWSARDTEEDAAQYSSIVWWPAVLHHAELSGRDDEVWADGDFRALVDRFFEHTLPLGAEPDFGDSAGWSREVGGLVWLLEKAGARWQDGRYRWLAHRVFDYHRRHVRDHPPRSDSLQASQLALAMAWWDADASLAPRAPAALAQQRAPGGSERAGHRFALAPGSRIGQRFTAPAARFAGFDLRLRVTGSGSGAGPAAAPAARLRVRLWPWRGALAATRAAAPLYEEERPLAPGPLSEVAFRPRLDTAAGSPLYLEISADAPLEVAGSAPGTEPDGGAIGADGGAPGASLWHRLHGLAGRGSAVPERHSGGYTPKALRAEGESGFRFDGGVVPDKLVLRSGFAPGGLAALFNLVTGYGHGQPELGALVGLVDGGALLVQDTPTPYWFHPNVPEAESAPLLRRYAGGRLLAPGRHARITAWIDTPAITVAELRWRNAQGWDVEQLRRIFFVKDRFVLVRDALRFPQQAPAMRASAGPVWHAAKLLGSAPGGFYDVAHPHPQSNVWRVRNPRRHLLVWLLPRPAQQPMAFVDEALLPPAGCRTGSDEGARDQLEAKCRSGPPWVIAQRWNGEARPGQTLWFDTLLLPHEGARPAAALAAGLRAPHVDGAALGLALAWGDEQWWIVDQPAGSALALPGLETDARHLVLRIRPGAPPYRFVHGATRLREGGVERRFGGTAPVEEGAPGGFARDAGG